jgi:hypothetical protein
MPMFKWSKWTCRKASLSPRSMLAALISLLAPYVCMYVCMVCMYVNVTTTDDGGIDQPSSTLCMYVCSMYVCVYALHAM